MRYKQQQSMQMLLIVGALTFLFVVAGGIGLFAVISWGGGAFQDELNGTTREKMTVTYSGTKATLRVTYPNWMFNNGSVSQDELGLALARKILEVAKANPKIKTMEVVVMRSREGSADKYGRPWPTDRKLGSFVLTDCNEVRKYADAQHLMQDLGSNAIKVLEKTPAD